MWEYLSAAAPYAAPIIGGLLGAESSSQGTSTTSEKKMDPRMDRYIYGPDGQSGLLGSGFSLMQQQMQNGGLNDLQKQGLDMKRQFLTSPQYEAGMNQMMGNGASLMGAGVAGNPFVTGNMPSFTMGGAGSGMALAPTQSNFTPYSAAPDYAGMVKDAYATIGRKDFGEGVSKIDRAGFDYWVSQLADKQITPAEFERKFYGDLDTERTTRNPGSEYAKYIGTDYNSNRGNSGAWRGMGANLPEYGNRFSPVLNEPKTVEQQVNESMMGGGGSGRGGNISGGGSSSGAAGSGYSEAGISAALGAMALSENPAIRALFPTISALVGLGGRAFADSQMDGISSAIGAMGNIANTAQPGVGSYLGADGKVSTISTPGLIAAADRAMFGDNDSGGQGGRGYGNMGNGGYGGATGGYGGSYGSGSVGGW